MAFNSIERAIENIERQPGWEQQRLYRRVLQSWPAVVGTNLARVCRPVAISNNNLLWVATTHSAVAQDLSFKRYDLLKKLNQMLNSNFVDLRFSPAKWHANKNLKNNNSSLRWGENKSLDPGSTVASESQIASAESLIDAIDRRSQYLPLCPSCQSPTPDRELERWQVCAYCAARSWSKK